MAQTGMYQPLQMDSRQQPAAAVAAAMVQFSQSPHGYAPLGTYGLSHQPPPNPQLSNAYGQQSLFVQPPAAHQGQDLYSSSQYRVQPPYPQSQHVSSNQVYAFILLLIICPLHVKIMQKEIHFYSYEFKFIRLCMIVLKYSKLLFDYKHVCTD